jgi:RecA-family ATPase
MAGSAMNAHFLIPRKNDWEFNNENSNVQQTNGLTGQVNNQAQTVNNIVGEAVAQPSAEEQTKEQLRQMLSETRIRTDTDVPPEEYALSVDEKGIFALRDIHAIKAKQKAGKTTTLKVFIAALLLGMLFRVKSLLEKPRIVFFDTEQSRTDTKLILEDVAQMTGLPAEVIDSQVSLHSLRRIDQEQLLPLLEVALEDEKPQVVMLDGIVEFVASFNDETESKQLIKDLLKLSDRHNCAIVCVLHTNKADEDHNMRGHLGTMLAQKSATVLECKKERGSSVITVTCSESRHEEMPEWSISFDAEGHIIDADEQRRQLQEQRKAEQMQKRQEALDKEKQERLEKCLRILTDKGGVVSRKQLTEILVKSFDRKRPTVATYISEWLKDGSLVEVNGMIQVSNDLALPF